MKRFRITSRLERYTLGSDKCREVFDIEEKTGIFPWSWLDFAHYTGYDNFEDAKNTLLRIMRDVNELESFKPKVWEPTRDDLTTEKLK